MYKTLTPFLDFLINQFFLLIFKQLFFTYIKLCKDSSAKYYQDNKEGRQKKACEIYQSFSKEEKGKRQEYGLERYKNLSEDENKSWLSIEKI